jgi:hypothetical protein
MCIHVQSLLHEMPVVAYCTLENHSPSPLVKYFFFQIIPFMIKANKWQYKMVDIKLLLQCRIIQY